MSYAWIIDRDHLAEEERRTTGKVEDDSKGVTGPRDAPDELVERLTSDSYRRAFEPKPGVAHAVYKFRLFDGDDILYYSGRMITDEGQSEEACYGPLGDFGRPNAGCTLIEYPGHPEMDCG